MSNRRKNPVTVELNVVKVLPIQGCRKLKGVWKVEPISRIFNGNTGKWMKLSKKDAK